MNVEETLNLLETAGAKFRFEGKQVRIWYPTEELRDELASPVAFLRAHREDVVAYLKARYMVPPMPPGIRLLSWVMKEPPVAIEACSIVTDSARFATTTLEQLRIALENPRRCVGWSVPQLLDRLAQVGVIVTLELSEEGNNHATYS